MTWLRSSDAFMTATRITTPVRPTPAEQWTTTGEDEMLDAAPSMSVTCRRIASSSLTKSVAQLTFTADSYHQRSTSQLLDLCLSCGCGQREMNCRQFKTVGDRKFRNWTCLVFCTFVHLQGGPAKMRPTSIFDGKIWMHRQNSINFGKCDNSNSGTHVGKHKSLIFNIVRQMAAPRLGIFDLVTFLILLTRTYSHRPIISLFQKVNKFYGRIVCL